MSKCDQCMYGCKTAEARNSPPMAAKKPTKFLSNSAEMLNKLGRRCDGSHEHKQLRGKDLSEAAFYPDGLVLSIIKGMNLTHAAEMVKRAMLVMPSLLNPCVLQESMGTGLRIRCWEHVG